ncbi:MAG: polymer-forming cytoskeletal protein [Candidatus Pacebacteria bacterium]|nr:polymer-forming cytoskeletal protein [Candidatus Paceibacterota bacterium]
MRKVSITLLICFLSLGAFWSASPVQGAVVHSGTSYELAPDTILDDDLYFVGNTLTLHGTTTGDVFGAGSHMILHGDVTGDAFLTAGRITVDGIVSGDTRLAGGVVTVNGDIREDVVIVGANVIIGKEAVIHGDLLVYGDVLILEGTVKGAVESHVRIAEVLGNIGYDATMYARESVGISGEAVVGGDLRYSAPREAFVSDTARIIGGRVFTPRGGLREVTGFDITAFIVQICMVVLGSVLLVWLFPRFTRRAVDRAFIESGWLTFRGFVMLFALPVFAVVFMVTLAGILPGVLLLLVYLAGMALAIPLAGVFAGVMLARWLTREDGMRLAWASFGAIVLVLVAFLPVIGWIVRALLFLLAFGTLCMLVYETVWVHRKENTPSHGKK